MVRRLRGSGGAEPLILHTDGRAMMIGPADIEAWNDETEDRSSARPDEVQSPSGHHFAPPYRFAAPRSVHTFGLMPSAAMRVWRDHLFGRLG